jgi:hypothetical protein
MPLELAPALGGELVLEIEMEEVDQLPAGDVGTVVAHAKGVILLVPSMPARTRGFARPRGPFFDIIARRWSWKRTTTAA